ncbi:MAG: UDP-N-acetylglucosamine 1-carboxyvinyltransferase [Candidatus Marinimicrobia bacterium]|jgi:UDP-N-acetylglucosamine 1-carboxyvinyltransferase|nr:UDP-N-acetylglucosamine 1-carboxyvinyltransferase [Candidatus Neomarinimicrobiota bacterium]MBT3634450.1 UDP-N-acetylglucosamine 1-carboxyvinyltransferase [Candidatus Neomarinimicrobiota bacterium]MBT3683277.1 UDP-N-acetylglucosamine 1-carboxyvinyltransferase [Candidatus Neomarinimicrobiota bacterium]MBT3760165.1 UDP-N-acetylglucosamine 1-carboxyvinyltransferase [Candidatus Neomarinimicrobiota bacterium]MBT3896260.1 UDP-N-acetylglucosamine 1-carboxyvinyltransferase [Candidatus Neomarinimicro
MDKLFVNGGIPLSGSVEISGAKNAVLPIMAATVISPGEYILRNVPNLRDTRTMARLLEIIGAKVSHSKNIMEIDTRSCDNPVAPYELVKTMRASFDILGALISRFDYAEVSLPGGCAWGPRPVNFHLDALRKLGAKVDLNRGNIIASGKLVGTDIKFEFPSVGATKNAITASVKAKGKTVISNAAREPEIDSLIDFLQLLGADIHGKGTRVITVNGKKDFVPGCEFTIIPDRIEAGTFLIAAGMIGGNITLENVNPGHLAEVIAKLRATGATINYTNDSIHITGSKKLKPIDITTAPYPGFPTDLQAQWMAMMTIAKGNCAIVDEIYHDRFTHIAELTRFGAQISLTSNRAQVTGVSALKGAPVMSTDIRASASLLIGALAAEGKSEISRVYHIDRGYEKIEEKFIGLGCDVTRVNEGYK